MLKLSNYSNFLNQAQYVPYFIHFILDYYTLDLILVIIIQLYCLINSPNILYYFNFLLANFCPNSGIDILNTLFLLNLILIFSNFLSFIQCYFSQDSIINLINCKSHKYISINSPYYAYFILTNYITNLNLNDLNYIDSINFILNLINITHFIPNYSLID